MMKIVVSENELDRLVFLNSAIESCLVVAGVAAAMFFMVVFSPHLIHQTLGLVISGSIAFICGLSERIISHQRVKLLRRIRNENQRKWA